MILYKVKLYLFFISLILICACDDRTLSGSNNSFNKNTAVEITDNEIQKFDDFLFIIKYSNIIYDLNGKEIEIPIFQGSRGNMTYVQFQKYCYDHNLLKKNSRESGFVIRAKKGELKKTFHNFLSFYRTNIWKNINVEKPIKMDLFGDEEKYTDWQIYYDFDVNGIPFVMKILFKVSNADWQNRNNLNIYKSVYQITPDENMESPYFIFKIYPNRKTESLFAK